MSPLDLSAFAADLAIDTKAYVTAAVTKAIETMAPRIAQLEAEILALKALAPVAGPAGTPGQDGAAGRDGVDGQPGRDGKDGQRGQDGSPGRDGIDGKDGQSGVHGKDGIDGVSVTGALVTRQGTLTLMLSDGQTKDVGPVVPDGELVTHLLKDFVSAFPVPKDGAPGPPGRDGTLEGLVGEFDGERTFTFARTDGSVVLTATPPIVLDRGVYKPGTWYGKGDGVTQGGSFWIAQETTNAKPGEAGADSRAWRLAVKRGTDGKAGRDGKDAE